MQPAAEPDEDFTEAVVGANQPPLETQTPTQRERPRFLGQKRVGPCLDEEAVGALGGDGPAEAAARLDQLDVEIEAPLTRQLHRAMGRRQRSHAAADDDELHWTGCREHGSSRGWPALDTTRLRWIGCREHGSSRGWPALDTTRLRVLLRLLNQLGEHLDELGMIVDRRGTVIRNAVLRGGRTCFGVEVVKDLHVIDDEADGDHED